MNLNKPFAKYIDHTILKADVTFEELNRVIEQCKQYRFAMMAINSVHVSYCKAKLQDCDVHIGAAIGFPLGQTTIETKVFEVKNAIENGCDEIDYVVNLTQVKAKNWRYIENEMQRIVSLCRQKNVLSKVIFETCYCTEEEIVALCKIATTILPDYVKTSTGFGSFGATTEHVRLMKSVVQDKVLVKASGGIKDLSQALAMIEAGADRIGTSSGVTLVEAYAKTHDV